jgi:hypothetical protein
VPEQTMWVRISVARFLLQLRETRRHARIFFKTFKFRINFEGHFKLWCPGRGTRTSCTAGDTHRTVTRSSGEGRLRTAAGPEPRRLLHDRLGLTDQDSESVPA